MSKQKINQIVKEQLKDICKFNVSYLNRKYFKGKKALNWQFEAHTLKRSTIHTLIEATMIHVEKCLKFVEFLQSLL